MELIKYLVHILSKLIYILVFIYTILCIPRLYGYYPVVVLSGSMEPTYKVGSIIYYKKPTKPLEVGDIITFELNNEFITHRINNIDSDDYIQTKGDANNVSDPIKIKTTDVIGVACNFSIPYVGYYIKAINSNMKFYLILVSIILVSEFALSNMQTLDIDIERGDVKEVSKSKRNNNYKKNNYKNNKNKNYNKKNNKR